MHERTETPRAPQAPRRRARWLAVGALALLLSMLVCAIVTSGRSQAGQPKKPPSKVSADYIMVLQVVQRIDPTTHTLQPVDNGLETFSRTVNRKIEEGYVLVGAPQFYSATAFSREQKLRDNIYLYQAMVKVSR